MDENEFQEFGGQWTAIKIEILRKYLSAYTQALKKQPNERTPFNLIYIDAFAGAGKYCPKKQKQADCQLFADQESNSLDAEAGSARAALEIERPFHEYYFIEKNPKNVTQLNELKSDYPQLANRINVIQGDSSVELKNILSKIKWNSNRAVLFLDPFALNVSWSTIEDVAETTAIDMWFLFSVHALNRMLPRNGIIDPSWSSKIDDTFGDTSWKEEFYKVSTQMSLLNFVSNTKPEIKKDADFNKINKYITKRLRSVFVGVAKEPRVFRNSQNSPIFSLFFAASNKNGKHTALKIADSILKKS